MNKQLIIVALMVSLPWGLSQAREKESYCHWGNGMTEDRLDTADDALLSETRPTHANAINEARGCGQNLGLLGGSPCIHMRNAYGR